MLLHRSFGIILLAMDCFMGTTSHGFASSSSFKTSASYTVNNYEVRGAEAKWMSYYEAANQAGVLAIPLIDEYAQKHQWGLNAEEKAILARNLILPDQYSYTQSLSPDKAKITYTCNLKSYVETKLLKAQDNYGVFKKDTSVPETTQAIYMNEVDAFSKVRGKYGDCSIAGMTYATYYEQFKNHLLASGWDLVSKYPVDYYSKMLGNGVVEEVIKIWPPEAESDKIHDLEVTFYSDNQSVLNSIYKKVIANALLQKDTSISSLHLEVMVFRNMNTPSSISFDDLYDNRYMLKKYGNAVELTYLVPC